MKKFFHKKRKAQQLVEFAIAVPILLIVLFIIIEFGNAINARVTVAEAVKMSLVEVNNLSELDGTQANKINFVEDFIERKVIQYLILHNIRNTASVTAKVNVNNTDETAVVFVEYAYIPYFLLSNLFGGAMPDSIPFSSSQTINPHIFSPNVFPATPRTTTQLASYSTDGTGTLIPVGALADDTAYDTDPADTIFNVREHIAFLLHFYGGVGSYPMLEYDKARLVSWEGHDLLPPNLRINLKTGTLEVRTPYYRNATWFDTRIPYIWVTSALGYTHLIFAKFNTYEMLVPEDSALYYKLNFGIDNAFYNKKIVFCGTGGVTGACDNDQRGTATVNERALRMNPRLGVGGIHSHSWRNNYIIGTIDPIFMNPATDFMFVKGVYFSYTTDYRNWDQQFFSTISSPHIIDTTIADAIYHPDMDDSAKNPFYDPFKYRLKLYEHDQGVNAGAYDPSQATPDTDDGNGEDGDGYYQVDIIDVYIDSDGDGIPDAWDGDPEYFDVNVNAVLDGNEPGADFWGVTKCRDGDITGICAFFPDDLAAGMGTFTEFEPSLNRPYIVSMPLDESFSPKNKTARYLPVFENAAFWRNEDANPDFAIYHKKSDGSHTRKAFTWWDTVIFPDFPTIRLAKSSFIHGTLSEPNITLDPSAELDHLDTNDIFSANSYVTRTPAGW